MKIFKYFLLWGLIIAVTIFVFIKLKGPSQKQWQTYQKEKEVLQSHPSTKAEMNKAKITPTVEKKIKTDFERYQGRRIVNLEKKHLDWNQLEFANEINPNWKEDLAERLLRKFDDNTKVLIKHKDSLIQIINGKPTYVEIVIITYLKTSGKRTGFTAYVDSATGRILKSWDRTRYENLPSRQRMDR